LAVVDVGDELRIRHIGLPQVRRGIGHEPEKERDAESDCDSDQQIFHRRPPERARATVSSSPGSTGRKTQYRDVHPIEGGRMMISTRLAHRLVASVLLAAGDAAAQGRAGEVSPRRAAYSAQARLQVFIEVLVPQEGFEPPTPSLRMMCSTD